MDIFDWLILKLFIIISNYVYDYDYILINKINLKIYIWLLQCKIEESFECNMVHSNNIICNITVATYNLKTYYPLSINTISPPKELASCTVMKLKSSNLLK